MSYKPSQLIVAGLAGLATAAGVTFATIQSRSPEPSNPPEVTSPTEKPSPASSPVPARTPISSSPNNPRPGTSKPEPVVITPPESDCKISMALVEDPNPPLNVRSSPNTTDNNNVVGQLQNNTFVSVAEEKEGWLRITDPVSGWISKNRTKSSCALVKKPIFFASGGNEAIVKGQIIGGGSHTYILQATKGQTLTVTNQKDVFPVILTPDGKLLAGVSADGKQTKWTGTLPATGEYSLQLDSNYKGFEYEFSVQVK